MRACLKEKERLSEWGKMSIVVLLLLVVAVVSSDDVDEDNCRQSLSVGWRARGGKLLSRKGDAMDSKDCHQQMSGFRGEKDLFFEIPERT